MEQSYEPFNSQEWPRKNFSLHYQYSIKQTTAEYKENINGGLWSNIIRIVWEAVRRITSKILGVKGLNISIKKRTLYLDCRSKRFLSQVIKLRASSWSSCPAVGASGTSFYFPLDDECSFSHYGLGLVGYFSLVK